MAKSIKDVKPWAFSEGDLRSRIQQFAKSEAGITVFITAVASAPAEVQAANAYTSITFDETTAPTPGTDQGMLYVKSDGKLYFKGQSEGNTEVDLTAGGGSDLSSLATEISSSYTGDNVFFGNLILAPKNAANPSVYVSGSVSIGTSSPLTALEVHHKNVDPTALSNDTGGGEVIYFGGGSSLTTGKLYYLGTDGDWALTDSDATSTGAEGLLAIALGATPGTHGLMIRGFFDANTAMTGCKFVKGSALYATSGSGLVSVDKPSTHGSFIRAVGHCTNTAKVIYLNPDGIYAEVKHRSANFSGIKTSSPTATTAWTFGSGSFTLGSGSSKY